MTRTTPAHSAGAKLASARFATPEEVAHWNDLIIANPHGGEVWASSSHLETKRFSKYRVRRLIIERGERPPLAAGVLAKRVPFLGEWWMVMAGPEAEDLEATLEASAAIAEFARAHGAFVVKIEPRLGTETNQAFLDAGYLPTIRRIPNESTVLVDVSGTEDEVFKRLGKKARNAINRGKREEIVVTRVSSTDENCARFFALLQETAGGGRFVLRPEGYFRTFWQVFEKDGTGQMFFAERDGQLLAAAYGIHLGTKTSYKEGASSREKQAYGVSHLLQWEVMRWANEVGATVHDLCGTPPSDRPDDTTHELHGVGKFKRSFQPEVTDYVGAFDIPLKAWAYRIWVKLGDPLARRLSLALRKDPYY